MLGVYVYISYETGLYQITAIPHNIYLSKRKWTVGSCMENLVVKANSSCIPFFWFVTVPRYHAHGRENRNYQLNISTHGPTLVLHMRSNALLSQEIQRIRYSTARIDFHWNESFCATGGPETVMLECSIIILAA